MRACVGEKYLKGVGGRERVSKQIYGLKVKKRESERKREDKNRKINLSWIFQAIEGKLQWVLKRHQQICTQRESVCVVVRETQREDR